MIIVIFCSLIILSIQFCLIYKKSKIQFCVGKMKLNKTKASARVGKKSYKFAYSTI